MLMRKASSSRAILLPSTRLIATVQELDADTYSAVSWAALQEALEDALAISTSQDPVSQAMIDSARDALQDAADALVDITRVKDKLAEAEALDESDYTEASWAALQTVLAQAREQMDQATSSREVTDIVMRIDNAMNALVEESERHRQRSSRTGTARHGRQGRCLGL